MDKLAARCRVIWRFMREEDGPTAVEYAVLLAIICGGVLVAMSQFGSKVHNVYVAIRDAVEIT